MLIWRNGRVRLVRYRRDKSALSAWEAAQVAKT